MFPALWFVTPFVQESPGGGGDGRGPSDKIAAAAGAAEAGAARGMLARGELMRLREQRRAAVEARDAARAAVADMRAEHEAALSASEADGAAARDELLRSHAAGLAASPLYPIAAFTLSVYRGEASACVSSSTPSL